MTYELIDHFKTYHLNVKDRLLKTDNSVSVLKKHAALLNIEY